MYVAIEMSPLLVDAGHSEEVYQQRLKAAKLVSMHDKRELLVSHGMKHSSVSHLGYSRISERLACCGIDIPHHTAVPPPPAPLLNSLPNVTSTEGIDEDDAFSPYYRRPSIEY